MYPLVRVDKRIPDGSIWQSRQGYLLPPVAGWTRVYGPAGTAWSNPLGGWRTQHGGISIFRPDRNFTISCHGPDGQKRFYIDIVEDVHLDADLVAFVDLFLDVMIDVAGVVTEKDEHQVAVLTAELQRCARRARDEVRRLIAAGDPLFDPLAPYYALPAEAAALQPPGAIAL